MTRIPSFSLMLMLGAASTVWCNVIDMTDDFESKVRGSGVTLVKFYAPWCGHCKRLEPIFKEASEKNESPGVFAEVNCDSATTACSKYEISGYPTLKLFRNGEMAEDYNGDRDVSSLLNYMNEQSAPAIAKISTVEEYKNMLDDPKHLSAIVFGYFTKEDNPMLKTLSKIADERLSKLRFAYTTDPAVLKQSGFTDKIVLHMPALIRSPKVEPPLHVYEGAAQIDDVKAFILKNKHGICGLRRKDNVDEFPGPLVVAYMSIDLEKNPGNLLYVRNRMIKVAKELQNKFDNLKFAISDMSDFYRELVDAGVEFDRNKVSVIGYDQMNRKFKMEKRFGVDLVVNFVTGMMEGKVDPTIKSEPIPENPIDEGVQVVVANNFNEVVTNADKDVFIEFYATWCGHCKKLAPVLASLAEKMKDNSDRLMIAKMNAADNEVFKPFKVEGFPTLYFIPKNDKQNPIKYQGGRTLEDFIEFLREHSTEPLVGFEREEVSIPEKEL